MVVALAISHLLMSVAVALLDHHYLCQPLPFNKLERLPQAKIEKLKLGEFSNIILLGQNYYL
jgi:hypothetical protein